MDIGNFAISCRRNIVMRGLMKKNLIIRRLLPTFHTIACCMDQIPFFGFEFKKSTPKKWNIESSGVWTNFGLRRTAATSSDLTSSSSIYFLYFLVVRFDLVFFLSLLS